MGNARGLPICNGDSTGNGGIMTDKTSITKYGSTECPDCGCVMDIPSSFHMPPLFNDDSDWACPQCGLVCRGWLGTVHWTTKRLRLAVSTDKYKEQRVFDAQEQLDKLLKEHPDIAIRFISGSRTGITGDNDLIIGEVLADRGQNCDGNNYWEKRIWASVEDTVWMLLVSMEERGEEIEELIKKREHND